jgi:hypothetical protein
MISDVSTVVWPKIKKKKTLIKLWALNAWPVTDIRHHVGLSPCVKNIVFMDFKL